MYDILRLSSHYTAYYVLVLSDSCTNYGSSIPFIFFWLFLDLRLRIAADVALLLWSLSSTTAGFSCVGLLNAFRFPIVLDFVVPVAFLSG